MAPQAVPVHAAHFLSPLADLCLRQDVGLWQDVNILPEAPTSCQGRMFRPPGAHGAPRGPTWPHGALWGPMGLHRAPWGPKGPPTSCLGRMFWAPRGPEHPALSRGL